MEEANSPRYANAAVIPALSMLSILLSVVPIALHWKNRNIPATCLICWFLILNVFNIVNAFIWPNDDVDTWWSGVGLCDIEVKVMIASYVAVPGNLMCIFRGLAGVLNTSRSSLVPSKKQRWQDCYMDALFCLVIPTIAMVAHIIYQANRYMLFGIAGCVNSFDESWMSLVLSWMWPPVICLFAAYYCSLILYRLHKYRSQFADILQPSNRNFSKSRFFRLFLLAFTMLLAIIPIQAYVVYMNVTLSLPWHPYSWSPLHGPKWNTIIKVPSNGEVFFDRWIPIASGFMFFIFFGCGRDASRISSSTAVGSTNSRMRLLFRKKQSSAAGTNVGNLASTDPANHSYMDLENGTVSSQKHRHGQKVPWHKIHLPFLNRSRSPSSHDKMLSLRGFHTPNTVTTNAWAATKSHSSNEYTETSTQKDFIRVQQVISQESETHM
ncbi:hypothetical protein EYZ11_006651 [Aspergillus tanneri]|uniref:A-factor receptor n=1 Tax=Aspergillus tanneri TaxID=1220188 RepID=A0A4S3JEY5_9EURO|nr:hypothetical protein EYZ11_006651 [Aspergillus tanneri]